MKLVPLFGSGLESYSPVVTSQRRVNCFYDVREDQDKQSVIIRGTPGSLIWQTLNTSPVRGWHVVDRVLYVVAGHTVFSISTSGIVTSLGSILTSSGLVSMDDNGVQVMIVDGTAGYICTIATGVVAQITDANFQNGARTVAFINGSFIVERPSSRQYYVSDLYDGFSWSFNAGAPVFGTKENNADQLLAVHVFGGILILMGTLTTEFWQDIGASPLPYARINGATQNWGLAAINSVVKLNNVLMFLGQSLYGGIKVFALSGYAPTPVSNSDVETLISSFGDISDAVALGYSADGHLFYQLTFPTADRTLLYDTTTNFWYEAQSGTLDYGRHFGNTGIAFNNLSLMADSTTGNIYKLDSSTYTDNGDPIKRVVTTRHVNFDGNEYGISELYLDMETGVGTVSGQGSDPEIMLDVSKDGGRTYPIQRTAKIGALGVYNRGRVIWRRLGASTDFVFRFSMTDPVKFTIISGSLEVRHSTQAQRGSEY